jgi:1-deoxy-D-xylulose-5-phosphate synthase
VLAVGKLVAPAGKAAETLAAEGIEVTVWDVRSCAPLDDEMLADAAEHRVVITVEDGVRDGGVGMSIADRIGGLAPAVPVHVLGIPAQFIPHSASPDHLLGELGLDADGIARTIRDSC